MLDTHFPSPPCNQGRGLGSGPAYRGPLCQDSDLGTSDTETEGQESSVVSVVVMPGLSSPEHSGPWLWCSYFPLSPKPNLQTFLQFMTYPLSFQKLD